jgi:hypothetical protein
MENIEFKSPIFTPRPGWGGKLKNWFKNNFYNVVIPLIAIFLVLVSVHNLSNQYIEYANKEMGGNIAAISKPTIEKVAQRGQGISHLARQALEDYLKENPQIQLGLGEKIFIENYFANNVFQNKNIGLGEKVEFNKNDILIAIERARTLSPLQISEWEKYSN